MLDRRRFLATGAGSIVATASGITRHSGLARAMTATAQSSDQPRKKVAFIGTWVKTHSHAQHFLDRLTEGYTWRGGWQQTCLPGMSMRWLQHCRLNPARLN